MRVFHKLAYRYPTVLVTIGICLWYDVPVKLVQALCDFRIGAVASNQLKTLRTCKRDSELSFFGL